MIAYYNENDPRAADWLYALMKKGLIAPGYVDQRSISDVKSDDLVGFTRLHFFAGIGGWDYALQLANWPDDKPVWTGSCPCQPFSVAGKGAGTDDKRHLWPDFYRLIAECQPPTVFGEQVASPLGMQWLNGVFADLESSSYAVAGANLCAAGVGSPHIRQRLYWVADANGGRCEQREQGDGAVSVTHSRSAFCGMGNARGFGRGESGDHHTEHDGPIFAPNGAPERMGNTEFAGLERHGGNEHNGHESRRLPSEPSGSASSPSGACLDFWHHWRFVHCSDAKKRRIKSDVEPLVDGFPARVACLRGIGNAIVPQVAAEFIKAFQEVSHQPSATAF